MTRTMFTAPYVVAYQDGGHRLLRDGCVVIDDDRIVFVGKTYDGHVDVEKALPNRVITPGFIDTHSHLHSSPIDKSVQEDYGPRQFWLTGLIEILPAEDAGLTRAGMESCVDYSLIELARSGTTTVLHLGDAADYVADQVDRIGMRGYVAPSYRSGRWFTPDGKRVDYEWDLAAGHEGLQRAIAFIEAQESRAGGRVQGFLGPAQVDTCAEELLRETQQAARELQAPVSLHASQGVWEFNEMTRRHGRTPVEWLADIDFLGPQTLLGHAIFISGNSWVNFAGDDLRLLADSRTSVSYNAWCFARRGILMESFPEYVDAGVNMCLGTDTAPQSMLESLRWTAISGKITSRRADTSTAQRVFDAATINAAALLGRDDLGRISAGAKADLLFWRTDSFGMAPLRDPIRNIVYYAQPSDLADVLVDGRPVVEDGTVLGTDLDAAARGVQAAGEQVWAHWHEGHWAGRTLDDLIPVTFPDFDESR
ncbi:amidohydrolase family protein [Flexivirga oryzae]|uniref:Cytosine/adenosine deaminase-related metal-dependent hydrolase n=1 Tax=Flexivirga oryzae TaxID=1794944 RepID=A0A839N7B5_9MICO|nr:amidohydrolase family protein [Flexivirga oryzae]MBB2891914.1 cytosine/adenosine deaminase-related metal-dependent hydrolase [Flexivirga oryzae]